MIIITVCKWLWGGTAAMRFGLVWIGLDWVGAVWCGVMFSWNLTPLYHYTNVPLLYATALPTEIGPYFSLYELIGYYDYGDFEDAMVSLIRLYDSMIRPHVAYSNHDP